MILKKEKMRYANITLLVIQVTVQSFKKKKKKILSVIASYFIRKLCSTISQTFARPTCFWLVPRYVLNYFN